MNFAYIFTETECEKVRRFPIKTQEEIMKLSGSPERRFVLRWNSNNYVRNWPLGGAPEYAGLSEAFMFEGRSKAMEFLLKRTHWAGASGGMWNSGLEVVEVRETTTWEEVGCD